MGTTKDYLMEGKVIAMVYGHMYMDGVEYDYCWGSRPRRLGDTVQMRSSFKDLCLSKKESIPWADDESYQDIAARVSIKILKRIKDMGVYPSAFVAAFVRSISNDLYIQPPPNPLVLIWGVI